MTPFRSIKRWTEELPAFRDRRYVLRDDLAQTICRAISRTENAPEDLLDRFLAVRTTSDALGSGQAGREIEGPMAIVILGGLVTSTALNLLVLPTLALRWGSFEGPVAEATSVGAMRGD